MVGYVPFGYYYYIRGISPAIFEAEYPYDHNACHLQGVFQLRTNKHGNTRLNLRNIQENIVRLNLKVRECSSSTIFLCWIR